jgi:hypothetical protein
MRLKEVGHDGKRGRSVELTVVRPSRLDIYLGPRPENLSLSRYI